LDAYFIPALDGVAYGLLLFVVAAGLVLCFGVANILNLAHGMMYAVGAYTAAALSQGSWTTLLLGLAVGTLAAALAGAALAVLLAPVARPGRAGGAGSPADPTGHLAQALLTFGVALAGGSLLVSAFGPDNPPVRVPAAMDRAVVLAGHPYPAYRLGFIVIAAATAALLFLAVSRTRAGMLVRAAANDAEMVACLGVSPGRVRVGVLTCGGALAGLAGVLGAPIIGPGPGAAGTVLLLSLVVVVLGGVSSVPGTLFAALAVGEIQTLGVAIVPAAAPFLLFAAMAVTLAVRSGARSPRWSPA
jgi:branched-subunit amino acid ABC-type transport system permease component